jgi:trigger factor
MTKIAVETVDSVRRRVTVEVPGTDVQAEFDRAYAKLSKTASVPGFRPGRVPRSLLEQRFGDQIRSDVFGKLMQESFVKALEEESLEPVGEPEIVTEEAEPGGPLRYSATLEVKPEVLAKDYTGFQIERPLRKVGESDIDQFLEELRGAHAQLSPVEDRPQAQVGDIATIDYEARIGEEVLSKAEGQMVEVTADPAPEAIGSRLQGAELGQTLNFEVDYAEDFADKRLAGRKVAFEVRLEKLAIKQLPDLDDEFAKDQGDCETLEQLREKVRVSLESVATRRANEAVRAGALSRLVDGHELEVPGAMVERRTEALVDEVLEKMGPRRPPVSQEPEVRERMREELRDQARDHVKAGLILEAIARQEKLQVSDEDLDSHVAAVASQMQPEVQEQVRALYTDENRRTALRAQLLQERALDYVTEQADLQTVEPKEESC